MRATEANLAAYEAQKAELAARNAKLLEEANKLAESLKGFSAVLVRQAAETGQLYGSVTIRDIAAAIKDAGFGVERRQVFLESAIKDLGVYQVKLNLHPEVSQTILVNVARTEEDAKSRLRLSQQNNPHYFCKGLFRCRNIKEVVVKRPLFCYGFIDFVWINAPRKD